MSIPIPQTDPKASYLAHRAEIEAAIAETLASGWYILGVQTEAFEREFAEYLGASHCLGVASGTDALQLALRACGVGAGDVVVTVAHTAVATVAAIELTGASPLLVEIDPETYTIDADAAAEAVKSYRGPGAIKAVIAVHLYGYPAELSRLVEVARRHDLKLIEDCAQAHGAAIGGRRVGTFGDIAAFSFYPTKNLGALGDGGAVVTDNPILAEKMKLLREYGWRRRYVSDIAGMNSRLDELQAAILRVKLKYLDLENARRREIAKIYDERLGRTRLTLPSRGAGISHVYHQYVLGSDDRDELRERLKARGVGTLIHYPVPVHQQPAYLDRVMLHRGGLPATERAARQVLSLPMFPQLTDEQVGEICAAVIDCASND